MLGSGCMFVQLLGPWVHLFAGHRASAADRMRTTDFAGFPIF